MLFLPNLYGGGAQRVFLRLYLELKKNNANVQLVVAQNRGELLSIVDDNDPSLFFLNKTRLISSFFVFVNLIRKRKPDIILSTMDYTNIFVGASILIASYKGMTVFRESNTMYDHRIAKKISLKRKMLIAAMRFFYKRATHVVANSTDIAKDLEHFGILDSNVVKIIENPVIDNIFKNNLLSPVEHPWLKQKTTPVILSAGRFSKPKNFELLFSAFAIVRKKINCRLILLGDGVLRGRYQDIVQSLSISPFVDMPGFVINPLPYMREATMFVSSSNWEGMPNVLVEALGAGMKIVATDCPGATNELLGQGKYGILVPPNDPQKLADAILKSIPAKCDKKMLANYANRFSVKTIAEKYVKLLEDGQQ